MKFLIIFLIVVYIYTQNICYGVTHEDNPNEILFSDSFETANSLSNYDIVGGNPNIGNDCGTAYSGTNNYMAFTNPVSGGMTRSLKTKEIKADFPQKIEISFWFLFGDRGQCEKAKSIFVDDVEIHIEDKYGRRKIKTIDEDDSTTASWIKQTITTYVYGDFIFEIYQYPWFSSHPLDGGNWAIDDLEIKRVSSACGYPDQGTCNSETCQCKGSYIGEQCQYTAYTGTANINCNNRGVVVKSSEQCICDAHSTGPNCQYYKCEDKDYTYFAFNDSFTDTNIKPHWITTCKNYFSLGNTCGSSTGNKDAMIRGTSNDECVELKLELSTGYNLAKHSSTENIKFYVSFWINMGGSGCDAGINPDDANNRRGIQVLIEEKKFSSIVKKEREIGYIPPDFNNNIPKYVTFEVDIDVKSNPVEEFKIILVQTIGSSNQNVNLWAIDDVKVATKFHCNPVGGACNSVSGTAGNYKYGCSCFTGRGGNDVCDFVDWTKEIVFYGGLITVLVLLVGIMIAVIVIVIIVRRCRKTVKKVKKKFKKIKRTAMVAQMQQQPVHMVNQPVGMMPGQGGMMMAPAQGGMMPPAQGGMMMPPGQTGMMPPAQGGGMMMAPPGGMQPGMTYNQM